MKHTTLAAAHACAFSVAAAIPPLTLKVMRTLAKQEVMAWPEATS